MEPLIKVYVMFVISLANTAPFPPQKITSFSTAAKCADAAKIWNEQAAGYSRAVCLPVN